VVSEKQPHFYPEAVDKAFATYASPIPLTDLRELEVQERLAKEAVLLSTPEGTALLKKETRKAETQTSPFRRMGEKVYIGANYGIAGGIYTLAIGAPGTIVSGALAYTGLMARDVADGLSRGDIRYAVASGVLTAFSGAISYTMGIMTTTKILQGIETVKQIHHGRDLLGLRDKKV